MSVPAIVAILFIQVILTDMKTSIKDIAITLLGIGYIPGFILYMPLLHGAPYGKYLIWYILFAAWGTDIFAYFIGRKYGRHKLTKVSPHKSIEGLIGGLARWNNSFFNIYTYYRLFCKHRNCMVVFNYSVCNTQRIQPGWRLGGIYNKEICRSKRF